nr:unnamed protein product [Haemonchus contortus]
MTSSIYPLIALLVVVRLSYQETVENDNFLRPRRNFFMSSGPSQARVMELERIVNTIVPRQSRNVVLVYLVLVGLLVCTTDTTLARELQRSYRGFFEPGEDPGDYIPPQSYPDSNPNEGFEGPPQFTGGEGGSNWSGMQGEIGGPGAPDGPGGPGWLGAESGFGSPFGPNRPDGPAGPNGGVDQDPQRNFEGHATAATVELVKEQILEY